MKDLSIKRKMICIIISHTPYYTNNNGVFFGLGPTVEEIDRLSTIFKKIYHFAPLHKGKPPLPYQPHQNSNIEIISMLPIGGKSFFSKIRHILYFPKHLSKIQLYLNKADLIHFRAPTGFGILFLPWLYLFWKGNTWIKYAGSWEGKNVPMTYKLQRWMLLQFSSKFKISINSSTRNLGDNFFRFINPCFDKKIINENYNLVKTKPFDKKLNLVFVGRVEEKKGIGQLLRIMKKIGHMDIINSLKIIGESRQMDFFMNKANDVSNKIYFTGSLHKSDIFKIYANSHLIILLSESEGLPKVLMEAGAFGCVPIVSHFSGISDVIINKLDGYILKRNDANYDYKDFQKIISDPKALKKCSDNIFKKSNNYTYEKYIKGVKSAILS